MTEDPQPLAPTPRDAVLAWWQAMQDKDTATLAAVLHEEHISAGGPGHRTVDRAAALADADAFLARGSVDSWEVWDVEERDLGGTAVCSYRWRESAHHDRAPFRLSGLATDVLVRSPRGWVIAAHHTSMTAPPDPAEEADVPGQAGSARRRESPAAVPERVVAAARCLAPAGGEHVLEIGCGTGAAAEHLLGAYPALTYTAVDRSAHAVRQTRRRTSRFLDSGRLAVVRADLRDLTTAIATGTRFDLAFAINVNVFWTTRATAEAAVLAAHLNPGARLCLVYELADHRRRHEIGERVLDSLDVPALRSTLSGQQEHLVISSRRIT